MTATVGIVMGSDSDWPVMKAAAEACEEFGIAFEADVVSAHRMPEEMLAYGRDALAQRDGGNGTEKGDTVRQVVRELFDWCGVST